MGWGGDDPVRFKISGAGDNSKLNPRSKQQLAERMLPHQQLPDRLHSKHPRTASIRSYVSSSAPKEASSQPPYGIAEVLSCRYQWGHADRQSGVVTPLRWVPKTWSQAAQHHSQHNS